MNDTLAETQDRLADLERHCAFLNQALNSLFLFCGDLKPEKRHLLLKALEDATEKYPPIV